MAIAPSPRSVLGGLAAAAVFLSHSLASAQAWTDRSLPPDQRAALLVAAMTQDEKIAFVHGAGGGAYVGHVPGIGRLGIPDLNLEDGPAGVADGMTAVTALPAPITLAASWDPDLAQRFGASIAAEQAGKGTNVVLGPMMNLDRAPAGGRNFEGFGEDPALAGAMAAAVVRGIQGAGLIATAKHYVDNEQETRRMTISSVVDDRTQHELYVLPFRACVDAGVGAVMCSYNQINGTFACEDPVTLGWLKGELGFKGWVMSDWGATHSTVASALAGLDMEMPGGSYLGATLASAVAAGDVPQSRLDDMVARVLASAFAAGLLDRAPSGSPTADVRSDAAVQLARDAAAQGTVLLKNSAATATSSALLPLQASSIRSIAVLGPAGDASPVFQGGGSSKVTATNVVTARQGIAARAGAVSVAYAQGAVAPFSDATSLAAQSDVAVVVVGVTSSEGADRSGLSLPAGQDQLISAVVQANPRTVVVVYAPAQVDMPWADQVPAIVFGGLPGQEEGDSLAAVLFGDVNPSGRLPMTFAAAEGDFPASSAEQFPGDGASVTYSEGFFIGYRHFDASHIAPLFPFGHGLSYTTFDYANLTVDPPVVDAAGMVSVSLDVTNTGATAGAEVVQLYVGLPAETSEPPLQLKGFQKVALDPGATQHVAFTLGPGEYSFFSAGRHEWIAYPGTYAVVVGSSSRDPRLTGSFD
ncbi:MAG TPA: glycoside hydrolase family 3 C-terminal domain-containing protein, partial [Polyangiaceae bacterium]|nr:glycoside hydrolase family 3 C-terminal domain-containing protein [Polyangiaceae bacterium]